MSRSSQDSSWGRRKSLFALSSLNPIGTSSSHGNKASPADAAANKAKLHKKSKHGRLPSQTLFTDVNHPDLAHDTTTDDPQSAPPLSATSTHSSRPSLSMKGSLRRPPSMFGSLRISPRVNSEEHQVESVGEPLSSTSSTAPSLGAFSDGGFETVASARTVLLHGEVQTSAGMFRKKKEYLVLTEVYMIRYKSQSRAAEAFKTIPYPVGRSPVIRHGSMPSAGSQSDLQTLSDSSGDKDGRVPLRQVVAVHQLDDGKPYFALEVCHLDEDSGQASAVTLQFNNPEERDTWLRNIRSAVIDARFRQTQTISTPNLENVARIVERDNDYNPSNCAIFKIVQRHSAAKSSGRSSSDDLNKVASTVCFLVVGVHKVHLVQLMKPVARSSSPSLVQSIPQVSYGILTLTVLKVSSIDDTFELTFRSPLQRPKVLYLASSASHDIAARLHFAENFLRPECGHRLFRFVAPVDVENLLTPAVSSDEEHSCLDRTLTAYCVAYGVQPTNVRYTIDYHCEDAPQFQLLPPADTRRPHYGPIELLAIMRALRYNESFGSLMFAGINLDGLNGLHDNYGQEYVCSRTKRGTPIRLTNQELGRSCLLVQEVRALAATSKKLRRMDFSTCVSVKRAAPAHSADDDASRPNDIGCGIVEALFPLCKHQTTNVDWICLNGINLSETDLDYLVGAAVEKSCHLRAVELNRCGLGDRSMGLILDALRAQDNTLEAVEIAGNPSRLNPVTFDGQLGMFAFIRKLNLSFVSRTSGNEPLIQAETLLVWRLQELRLSGTPLNAASIDAIGTYLAHPQSNSLHELFVDNAYLTGGDVATLLHSMTHGRHEPRDLHLDISQSHLHRDLDQFIQCVAGGFTPSHLSMRAIEWREDAAFRKMIAALTGNTTISFLDMSQAALPGNATEDTCRALEKMLAENSTLVELDMSGEDSRLATSKFGPGINQALNGLKHNRSLRCYRIERQRLGLQGASTLAEVLKENAILRELHCDHNEIPLQGLTDLVNSLIENTTLMYLPTMDDGRATALKSAEITMKEMSDTEAPSRTRSPSLSKPLQMGGGASAMKRGLASVRRSAARSASAYTPSFPALPHGRSTSSPDGAGPTSPPFSSPTSPVRSFQPSRQRQNSVSATPVSATSSMPISFTVQDIQTTHRLLTEQWDRQCYRLSQYLDRNWNILNGATVDLEVEDEKFERPESVGSLGKLLEQVKYDTTPRVEKDVYFDDTSMAVMAEKVRALQVHNDDSRPSIDSSDSVQMQPTLDAPPRIGLHERPSFKQFILDSGSSTSDEEDGAVGEDEDESDMTSFSERPSLDGADRSSMSPKSPPRSGLRKKHKLDRLSPRQGGLSISTEPEGWLGEPRTPTQGGFEGEGQGAGGRQ